LQAVPIYFVNTYNVSVSGACYAAMLHQRKKQ
jgi:hypothetical protein